MFSGCKQIVYFPRSQARGDRSFHARQRRTGKEFPYNYRSGEFLKILWRRGSRSHRRVITKFGWRMDVPGKFTAPQDSGNQIWKNFAGNLRCKLVTHRVHQRTNEQTKRYAKREFMILFARLESFNGGVLQYYSIPRILYFIFRGPWDLEELNGDDSVFTSPWHLIELPAFINFSPRRNKIIRRSCPGQKSESPRSDHLQWIQSDVLPFYPAVSE